MYYYSLPKQTTWAYFFRQYGWIFIFLLGLYLLIPWQNAQKKASLELTVVHTPTSTPSEGAADVKSSLPLLDIAEQDLVPSTATATVGYYFPNKPDEIIPGQLLVKFKEGIVGQDIVNNFSHRLEAIPFLSNELGIYRVVLDPEDELGEFFDLYAKHPGIERVDVDRTIQGLGLGEITPVFPNDASFGQQWSLHNEQDHDIDAPEAWFTEKGSEAIVIGVIDSGIDGTHEDLVGKVEAGINFIGYGPGTPEPEAFTPIAIPANTNSDDNGHGTSAAGIITALSNNTLGITGVSWNSKLVPIKVLDYDQSGSETNTAAGIIWAANQDKIRIICMSLGGEAPSLDIETAIESAFSKGKVLIAASGNSDQQGIYYPAAYPEVIAIGAGNQNDERCDRTDWGSDRGSSYGPELDLLAPGHSILSTIWLSGQVNQYANFTGTSAAAPHVCGVAALLLSDDSSLTNLQVQRRLQASTDKVAGMGGSNFTYEYGYGRLNSYRALTYDMYDPSVTLQPVATVLPSRPTFYGTARDDRQDNDKVASELADVTTSNIEKVEVSIDEGTWVEIIPTQKTGSLDFNFTTENALADGNHTLKVRATDTQGNITEENNYAVLTFQVSQSVTTTPILTFTPTQTTGSSSPTSTPIISHTPTASITHVTVSPTFTLTPTTKPAHILEVKVLYRYYTSSDKKNYKDYPISGAKVLLSDLPWERYTNVEGVAYFDGILAGKQLVSAFYGSVVKQIEVKIPDTKSIVIIFEAEVASSSSNTSDDAATDDSNKEIPETGMNVLEIFTTVRLLCGLLMIIYSFKKSIGCIQKRN